MGDIGSQSGQFYSDLRAGALPSYTFISPNLIDDAHSSSIQVGDSYLQRLIPLITAGPNYQAGDTDIVITYDEGAGKDKQTGEDCTNQSRDQAGLQPSCNIPFLVVAPYEPAGHGVRRLLHALLPDPDDRGRPRRPPAGSCARRHDQGPDRRLHAVAAGTGVPTGTPTSTSTTPRHLDHHVDRRRRPRTSTTVDRRRRPAPRPARRPPAPRHQQSTSTSRTRASRGP